MKISEECKEAGLPFPYLKTLVEMSQQTEGNLINWQKSKKPAYRRRFELILKACADEYKAPN